MNEVEEYLKERTFYCSKLKAKISSEQCKSNQVRAYMEMKRPYKSSYVTAPDNEENFFWKDENDNPNTKCLTCDVFTGATKEQMEVISSSTTMKRYPPTEDGKVAKKLLHYQYNHQEKLYAEEEDYLSRSPSRQKKVAKLHIETS